MRREEVNEIAEQLKAHARTEAQQKKPNFQREMVPMAFGSKYENTYTESPNWILSPQTATACFSMAELKGLK